MVLASDSFCNMIFDNLSTYLWYFLNDRVVSEKLQKTSFQNYPQNKFLETATKRNNLYSNKYDQIQVEREGERGVTDWTRSCSCWARVRGLIPLRSTLSCIWSPLASIWSLTHLTSSSVAEIRSPAAGLTVGPGQEQMGEEGEERGGRREKSKIAAAAADSTRTGTFAAADGDDQAMRELWVTSVSPTSDVEGNR